MIITKTIEIEMGHRIPNHTGKCKNLHGHRYVIKVAVQGEVSREENGSDEGMVMDYANLKDIMMRYIDDVYDHSFTLCITDKLCDVFGDLQKQGMKINFVGFVPTAENLAKHWYYIMTEHLPNRKIEYVKVNETSSSSAIYQEGGFNG